MAMDSPLTICKDLWRTQSRAFSLLFYSIRRVFFCSLQALGFNFWNIEFRLLLLSFPRLLKSVAIFSCSPHPLFFSWSWWIWIRKSLVAASIIFLIKDNIGLGTKACQKRSLSLSLNERLAPNYRPLFSCFLRLSSAWYEHLFSGLSGSCSGVMQKDHVPGHFLSSSEDIPERLVLINLLSQAPRWLITLDFWQKTQDFPWDWVRHRPGLGYWPLHMPTACSQGQNSLNLHVPIWGHET